MSVRLLLTSGEDYRELPTTLEDEGFELLAVRAGDTVYEMSDGTPCSFRIDVADSLVNVMQFLKLNGKAGRIYVQPLPA